MPMHIYSEGAFYFPDVIFMYSGLKLISELVVNQIESDNCAAALSDVLQKS